MKRYLLAPLAIALAATATLNAQNRIGTGKVATLYAENCASCHGENLEGGLGSSLNDGIWNHGSSDAEIAKNISQGLPDAGMVGFSETLSSKEIRSLVVFFREQEQIAARAAKPLPQPVGDSSVFQSEHYEFTLEKIAQGEGILWGIDFLPDDSMLITQRDGVLWHRKGDTLTAIKNTPEVWQRGQGGLLEVAVHPDYAKNGWIYLGYSENTGAEERDKPAGMTAIARGRIKDGKWTDNQKIFSVPGKFHTSAGSHFGTRFVFQDGYLFFSIGDRGRQNMAQDLTRPNGKIHRIHDDGRIPQDNPFIDQADAYPTIWTYGNRNPQALNAHPETGALWEVEHGPRGGDEVNLIQRGLNYGWPAISYGMNYNGTPITDKTHAPGMEQPKHYWVPSIAICGADFYTGDLFPKWKNNYFVSGMASQELHRLVIEGDAVVQDEIVFSGQGRIRDVATGPDGALYLLISTTKPRVGAIYRLAPATPERASAAVN